MDENYLITIKGTMEQGGRSETVELMTHGALCPAQRQLLYYV